MYIGMFAQARPPMPCIRLVMVRGTIYFVTDPLRGATNFSWNPSRPAGQRLSRGVRLLRDSTVPRGPGTHAHVPAREMEVCRSIWDYVLRCRLFTMLFKKNF